LFQGSQLEAASLLSSKDAMNGCIADAEAFLTKPETKHRAIERAMDHCALSKKVDDKNFVCPHYRELLNGAFRREPTDRRFTANAFCTVAETFLAQLSSAAKIPNMGKGEGFKFKVSKDCKPIVTASMEPQKKLPSATAPDFWYALCMNQDCAHFLPSRTRWCTENHQPTHSATVCEAMRTYAHDEVQVLGSKELDADQVCGMYQEFVDDSNVNIEAYMHVVHGVKHKVVPVPEDPKRALESAKMKHDAKKHGLRDAAGQPVKSAAAPIKLAVVGFAGLSLWFA